MTKGDLKCLHTPLYCLYNAPYNSILISQKIVQISFGVEERFFKQIFKVEKRVLQKELFGAEFEYLFFSVRALNAFYHSKEIIEAFLSLFALSSIVFSS